MDTRDTQEQAELRRAARRLAHDLGPPTVPALDDPGRAGRLAAAVRGAGWLELRDGDGDGGAVPLAGGVEPSIVAEALGAAAADVAFSGPVLASDLARRAGVRRAEGVVVAFAPALIDVAVEHTTHTGSPVYAVDCERGSGDAAYVLVADGAGHRLATVPIVDGPTGEGTDLTRTVREVPADSPVVEVPDQDRLLTRGDLDRWCALGLALTCADLVGIMRGVLDVTVAYTSGREQYGVPVGSFQAVQHLLAEAHCLMEGSLSVTLRASWAVDELPPGDAVSAGRVAKAYCVRAARTVCETAVQVHGGIGNTWDCMVHVYLRRALLSSQWFGDDGVNLRSLQCERLEA